jgi:hypothetical protein
VIEQDMEGVQPFVKVDALAQSVDRQRHSVRDVSETLGRERSGFSERGHCDASEMAAGLKARRLDALVGFDVRPQPDTQSSRLVSHSLTVPLESVEVDDRARGFEFRDFHRPEDINPTS